MQAAEYFLQPTSKAEIGITQAVRTVRTGCGGMESGDSCFVEVAEHLLRARGLVRKATTWR